LPWCSDTFNSGLSDIIQRLKMNSRYVPIPALEISSFSDCNSAHSGQCLRITCLKIQETFGFFNRYTGHCVGANHRGFQIAVAEQFLNGANIDVRLQLTGETMAKNMRRSAFGDATSTHG
jgi:hypothetical protein